MDARQDIDIRVTIAAPPGDVFRLLDDSSSWPSWTPIDSYQPVLPRGDDGLGEQRRFRTGRVRVTERIVERRTDRRLTYVLLDGLAVNDYRAEIDLEPVSGGTAVRWHTTFAPRVRITGWLYRRVLYRATEAFVDGLRHAAER